MKRTRAAAFLAVALAVFSLPCRNKEGIKGLDLTVAFSARTLSDDLFVDVSYKWKTSSDFRGIPEDLRVFVRFEHGGDLLLQDDHAPDIPTSEWAPGREYAVTRKVYIPPFIDEFDPDFRGTETVALTVGLSGAEEDADSGTVLLRRGLRVSPAPLTPAVLYMDGWHEPETDAGGRLREWEKRWTGREARCLVDNPKRNAYLVIRGAVDREAVPGQEITVRIDDTVLEKFVPEGRDFEKHYSVGKELLGDRKDFFLVISVDRTFVPARVFPGSDDTRELGVLVSFIYFK